MLRRYSIIGAASLIATWLLCSSSALAGQSNWQLVFKYDKQTLQLVKADRVPAVSKQIQTPGLKSAPIRLEYSVEWLVDGAPVYSGQTEVPLGIRAAFEDGRPCRMVMPNDGVIVVRVPGPDEKLQPQSLRMSRPKVRRRADNALAIPSPFEVDNWIFSLPAGKPAVIPLDGPVGVTKIRNTGPDENRLVTIMLGDGYTADNLAAGRFESAVDDLADYFDVRSPWDILSGATNIYRIDVESNEEGADHEVYGVLKDTYFNSSFWVSDIERLLALTGDGYWLAIEAADNLVGPGVWDVLVVVVNSTKYGGSGGGVAVVSVHSSAREILLHELGHTFAYLADEYSDPYPGYPPGDPEPNVDFDYSGPELKWIVWVEPETPLPTPPSLETYFSIGAFAGARYLTRGIFRPMYNCKMRALGYDFCTICKEAHIFEFTDMLSLVDEVSPEPASAHIIAEAGTLFSTTPLPLPGLEYEWSVDGVPLAGETEPSLLLTPAMLGSGDQALTMNLNYISDMIRIHPVSLTYTWTVRAEGTGCCTGIVGDANFDGGYEPTIGDISVMVEMLFISGTPLTCYEEADVNQSGGIWAGPGDITIGDISTLVDYLFVTRTPVPECL